MNDPVAEKIEYLSMTIKLLKAGLVPEVLGRLILQRDAIAEDENLGQCESCFEWVSLDVLSDRCYCTCCEDNRASAECVRREMASEAAADLRMDARREAGEINRHLGIE